MDAHFLLKGLALGFLIAAPVGPIGVLCIRRTLTEGRLSGLLSGLGAATADAFYGTVAGFGLTLVSDVLLGQRTWLNLVGGAFLCCLGIRTFLAEPAQHAARAKGGGLARSYLSTLALTLSNPMTILSFAATFAGAGATSASGGYRSSVSLVIGVFAGSALWWLGLTSGVQLLRSRVTHASLRWLNRLSGLVLVAFGVGSLWTVLCSGAV